MNKSTLPQRLVFLAGLPIVTAVCAIGFAIGCAIFPIVLALTLAYEAGLWVAFGQPTVRGLWLWEAPLLGLTEPMATWYRARLHNPICL